MIIGKIKTLFNKIKEILVPNEVKKSDQKIVEKHEPIIKQLKKNK